MLSATKTAKPTSTPQEPRGILQTALGPLTPHAFEKICGLVYRAAGIRLGAGKEALVVSRLTRKLRETGCQSFEEYIHLVGRDENTLTGLVDALTTNYTAFLREPTHFDFLRETILPTLATRPSFSLWCAAAATGEEPYSLAFTVLEALGMEGALRARIVATDISTQALAAARRAIYPAKAFSSVPTEWLPKYLLRGEGANQGLYQVKREITQLVAFSQLNLVEDFSQNGLFPLISCRNVMIYFDRATQEKVVHRLVQFLEPGGYLFVGHSESLTGLDHTLRFVKPAIYQKALEGVRKGGRGAWK